MDSLLFKLCGMVNAQWYHFGLAIRVPKEFLESLKGYSEEHCLIELLDYWLRCHPGQPTWKELADAVDEINRYQPARVFDPAS